MALSDVMVQQISYLRRYARILTGSQAAGDGLVLELLEAALADPDLRSTMEASRVGLFAAFSDIYRSSRAPHWVEGAAGGPVMETVANRLNRATTTGRQALLLHAIEDFSVEEIALILDTRTDDVADMIDEAREDVDDAGRADVLIIEDEPLIAFQLEELVREMGNRVAGIATTHEEAVALFRSRRPGIVLADIQLADGSSGIDAVNEILGGAHVPVIFITAFPERLLTGERPEPTFLITKPFSEAVVRATIGQVMFFGSIAPVV